MKQTEMIETPVGRTDGGTFMPGNVPTEPNELVFSAGQPIKEVNVEQIKLRMLADHDPLLYEPLREYDFDEETVDERVSLVKALDEGMRFLGGIGLSANQAGIFKRVFVMRRFNKERNDFGDTIACFNPEILDRFNAETDLSLEGCLSSPGLVLKIKRYKTCHVRYRDVDGLVVDELLSGIEARCFQHELDHMNGICFTKKVSPGVLSLAREKQRKLVKKYKKGQRRMFGERHTRLIESE